MRRASGAEARVGGHHAVDVGPDFDALGVEAGAKDRRGKIRASAADGGGDAGAIRTNEPAHHRNLAGVEQRLDLLAQAFVGFFELRNGAGIGAVGEQTLARIHVRTGQSAGDESGSDDLARKHFAERGNVVVGARSDFADRANAAQQFVQIFEVGAQVAVKFGEQGGARAVLRRCHSGVRARRAPF